MRLVTLLLNRTRDRIVLRWATWVMIHSTRGSRQLSTKVAFIGSCHSVCGIASAAGMPDRPMNCGWHLSQKAGITKAVRQLGDPAFLLTQLRLTASLLIQRMELGPYLISNRIEYQCTLCERVFATKGALYAHCRNTTRHERCERCCRVFISTPSKDEHLKASRRHKFCLQCSPSRDFETLDELETHLTEYHHFCSDGNLYRQSAEKLREHDVHVHNLLSSVRGILRTRTTSKWYKMPDQHCAFDADLTLQHQQKHQPQTMGCCGCYKTFKSFSGVLIHLESGGCSSNITEDDVDDLAHECYQSRKYINYDLEDGGWLYACHTVGQNFQNSLPFINMLRMSRLAHTLPKTTGVWPSRNVLYPAIWSSN